MPIKHLLSSLGILLFVACSWTHHVRLENATNEPVTVTYHLSCTDFWCFFPDSAVVTFGALREVYHMDTADSTISFTLPAGATAELAQGSNTTYRQIHENSSGNPRVDNLVWMRITTPTGEQHHTAAEFVTASDNRKGGLTLLRIDH